MTNDNNPAKLPKLLAKRTAAKLPLMTEAELIELSRRINAELAFRANPSYFDTKQPMGDY